MKLKDYGIFVNIKEGVLKFFDIARSAPIVMESVDDNGKKIQNDSIKVAPGLWDCKVECDDSGKPEAIVISNYQFSVYDSVDPRNDWFVLIMKEIADKNAMIAFAAGKDCDLRGDRKNEGWAPDSGPVRFAGNCRVPCVEAQTAFWLVSKPSFVRIECRRNMGLISDVRIVF
jgi:hypothetical protein